jgi:hypothetical protein
MNCLKDWKRNGGVMIVGYEGFRQIWQANRSGHNARAQGTDEPARRLSGHSLQVVASSLSCPLSKHLNRSQNLECKDLLLKTSDLIIADEGHRVKNSKSTLAQSLKDVKTHRRIVLTGTPLQNNCKEYFTMLDFVRPHFLGSETEFNNRFDAPIRNGQCLDSTPGDVKLMKSRIHVLYKKLEPLVHRVEYDMLGKGGLYSALKVDQTDNSDLVVPAPHDPAAISTVNTLPTKHECEEQDRTGQGWIARWTLMDHDLTFLCPLSCVMSGVSRRRVRSSLRLPTAAVSTIHRHPSHDTVQGVSCTHEVSHASERLADRMCTFACTDVMAADVLLLVL